MSARRELRALTGARGIAAWLVVLYHIRLAIAGLPPAAERVLAKGYLAVDFFFLLSGFVVWLSWGARLRERGPRAVPGFWRRRIARVWPLHLVILAGAVPLALALAATGRADPQDFPFAELPLHVLLVQNWGFVDQLAWNDPAWSVSCELAAYLLFPLLAFAIDWQRVPSVAVLGALAALFVLLGATFAAVGAGTLGQDITGHGVIRCLIEFAAGTAVAALWLRWRDQPRALPLLVAGALAAIAATGALPEPLIVPPALAALLLALALTDGWRRNPLAAAPLHALGEVSYATYLAHFLMWFAFKLALVHDPHAVPPPLVALYLALVLGASFALYHLVERPAQRAINGWSPRSPLRLAPRL